MIHVHYLKAFTDNYIWIIRHNFDIVIIDPGESAQVLDYIIDNKLNLKAILVTHSHNDHIGGVSQILDKFPVPVYGYADIATAKVGQDSIFSVLDCQIRVIYNPGHTMDSVSYLLDDGLKQYLFCGDTLFSAGCGRVFTENYEAMLDSLNRLSMISPDTLVYPGHEYTLKNLDFAKNILPDDEDIQRISLTQSDKLFKFGTTLPSSIALELATNPFLRLDDTSVKLAINALEGKILSNKLDYFISLRKLRNNF